MMKTVKQRVGGKLLAQDGRYALLLLTTEPEPDAADLLHLRYPFVTHGMEELIFPAFILDDWGGEIKGLKLYRWFHEFAEQFPRAEIFGFDGNGHEVQCFVREIEPYDKLPCYAYASPEGPLTDGALVEAILLPHEEAGEMLRVERPSWVKRPLRSARVSWWQVNPKELDRLPRLL